MTQFLRDQASDSEEVDTPLMLDGTYLSRNFATLGPLPDSRRVISYSLIIIIQILRDNRFCYENMSKGTKFQDYCLLFCSHVYWIPLIISFLITE